MFAHGDRVQWLDGRHTCTGTIVCNLVDNKHRPTDYYEISVDTGHSYNRACHTAHEMHMGWVCRSVSVNGLRKEEITV
jgi:hypothetical protein